MKKKIFSLLLIAFITFSTNAQITDSINVNKEYDSLRVIKQIDSVKILTAVDSLRIKMDSLLKPFYVIHLDTLTNTYTYIPKYRMVINPLNLDTSYVSIPKESSYIITKKSLKIDTIKVLSPITPLTITTAKYADDPIWWNKKNSIGIDISEAAFVNWNAGGNNSISGLLKLNLIRTYKKLHLLWNNELFIRYGLNNQQDIGLRKTDDKLQYNSTFGYRRDTISNWFYSVKLNFSTQFTNGYSYPDTDSPISRFFSPAYLFLGAGTQYELKDRNFSIYISPITLKSTFVLDDNLSNDGAFGVKLGKNSRHEFGTLIQSTWDHELFKNVGMSNKLSLYSDYLNKYGNIDINWELHFNLTINKYLKASLGGFLIYDDDIKFKDDVDGDGTLETFGPRVQLKQLLGIGVLFIF